MTTKNKMNICFVSPEVPPYLSGGAGVATLNFSKVLVQRGFKVTIIARKLAGGKSFENVEGVDVYQLSCTKIRFLQLSHIIFTFKSLYLLWKLQQKNPIDLCYSQTLISPGIITALSKAFISGKTIVHGRGIDIEEGFLGIKKYLSLWVLKKNDFIFLLSSEHLQKVREILEEEKIEKPLFLLTNGVNITFQKTKEECRKTLGFEDGYVHMVYIGRLDHPKGIWYALEAIADMEKIKFHILGEETSNKNIETQRLKKFVADHHLERRVFFYGNKDRETTYTFCKAADIFIHPLLIAAGMGNAVLEAMYLGTPVIGTNIGYFKEIIADGVSGLLVEPGNSLHLKRAIQRLEKDKELAQKMAEKAKEYVQKNHDWNALAQRLEDFLLKNGLLKESNL